METCLDPKGMADVHHAAVAYDDTMGQWFFYDKDGIAHYADSKEAADAMASIVWEGQ